MNVGEIMHTVISVDENTLIKDAVKKMDKFERASVLITSGGKPVGIFTEKNLLRLVANGEKILGKRIRPYYQRRLVTTDENTVIEDVGNIMEREGVRRVLVTHEGNIIGIVTARSIAKNMRYSLASRLVTDHTQADRIASLEIESEL